MQLDTIQEIPDRPAGCQGPEESAIPHCGSAWRVPGRRVCNRKAFPCRKNEISFRRGERDRK